MPDGWMDRMDNAWMGAMTDVTDNVWTDGDSTRSLHRYFPHFSPLYYWRISMGFQLTVTEWMIDSLVDEQMNLVRYRQKGIFLGFGLLGDLVQEYLWVFSP